MIRFILSLAFPFFALLLQWVLWPWIGPSIWFFFFFLAVFFSARVAGFYSGILSTVISSILVWYFFIPPQLSWSVEHPNPLFSVILFLFMGYLFSETSKRIKRTQQRTKSQFLATFEQAAVGIAHVAPDGKWLRVNKKLCEILGYSEKELHFITFQDISYPDDLEKDLDLLKQVLKGNMDTYSLEKRYIHKNGSIIWANLTVSLVRKKDFGPDYFISVVEDITERKEIDILLEEAQALAQFGYWHWDYRIDKATWSKEMYSILGRDSSLGPADFTEIPRYFAPDSWQKLSAAVNNTITTGEQYELDVEVVQPDGKRFWVISRGQPVYNAQGEIIELRGTLQDITERKKAEEEIKRTEAQLKLFIEHAPISIAMFDIEMTYIAASGKWGLNYCRHFPDFIGQNHYKVHPDLPSEWIKAHQEGMKGKTIKDEKAQWVQKDGFTMWLDWTIVPWKDRSGEIGGIIITTENITEKIKNEERLRLMATVFNSAQEGVAVTDLNANIIAVNKAFTTITEYTEEEVLGKTPNILCSNKHTPDFYQGMWRSILEVGSWQGEIWNRRKSGDLYIQWLTISTVFNNEGQAEKYVGISTDISRIKHPTSQLEHLAHHDALTYLPNRLLFTSRLEHSLARSRRNNSSGAVLFFDLDRFKAVNDSYGHHAGDELLQQIAERLWHSLRGVDTIARLGGDEFVVMIDDIQGKDQVSHVAEVLLKIICKQFQLKDGHPVKIGCSIGISLFPQDGKDVKTLLQKADTALYQIKREGGNSYRYYDQITLL